MEKTVFSANKDIGNLIEIGPDDKRFAIDLRYAGENNFTSRAIYPSSRCYLDKRTAELLYNAAEKFEKMGLRLKIWDAYRPVSAQRRLREVCPNPLFVAYPPVDGEKIELRAGHMNGMAVDVTLTDDMGNELIMPTGFDAFSLKAMAAWPFNKAEAKKNAALLKKIMEECGFKNYTFEWWHYSDRINSPAMYLDYIPSE